MERNIDTVIQFSGLKLGNYTYDYTLDDSFFSDYKNEKILGGNVVFNVKMEKRERMLMFYFHYEGSVRTTCDRCLEEMDFPVKGDEQMCVKFSDTEKSDNEDITILPEKAFEIDLSQWMYEYVAVSIPIQTIHSENGCNPEMMKYLSEENNAAEIQSADIDPRWDVLRQLSENK